MPSVIEQILDSKRKSMLKKLKERTQSSLFESCCDDCEKDDIEESAEFQGQKVTLNKPFRLSDGNKKFGVYVKNGDKVKKVTFGDPNMEIKRDDDEARKSFRARHDCANQKDKTSAAYWSCKMWEAGKSVSDVSEEALDESIDVFFDEDLNENYYIELCEETLEERKIHIRINSKGKRIRKIKCPKGRVAKVVNGRTVCVTPSGSERLHKKVAIKKSVRTKKAKGAGFKKKVNFRRQKAMKFRKNMGVKNNTTS